MKKHCLINILTVLTVVSSAYILAGVAAAQSASSPLETTSVLALTAIPPRTEVITVKPGTTYQGKIQVRNATKVTQTVVTEAQDFIIDKDGKTPIPVSDEEAIPLRWSLASWVTITPQTRTVAPQELVSYDYVIRPGGHYAMITHRPSQETPSDSQTPTRSASSISQKVGTLLYVIIEGDIHEEAFIRGFTAPSWVEYGPVPITYSIENVSDIHITPQASIEIRNLFGKVVTTLQIEPLNIFPYSTRSFSAQLDRVWGLGPYFAHLTVPYGTGGKIVSASLVFWMIPYRLLLAVMTILLTISSGVIVIKRHLDYRNDIRNKHIEVLEERIHDLEERVRDR